MIPKCYTCEQNEAKTLKMDCEAERNWKDLKIESTADLEHLLKSGIWQKLNNGTSPAILMYHSRLDNDNDREPCLEDFVLCQEQNTCSRDEIMCAQAATACNWNEQYCYRDGLCYK